MRKWFRAPEPGNAKTWLVLGRNERGDPVGKVLKRLVASFMAQSGGDHTSSGSRTAVPSHRTSMKLQWPWTKFE